MKYHNFFLVFICLSLIGTVSAQTPCNQRAIANLDFTFNGGTAPARWNLSQANATGFSLDEASFAYVPTGNFSNQNVDWQNANNNKNATRQYAIVKNPKDLSPQYADIPTDGMMVINPKQGEDDQYGQFQIANLKPLQTYYVEIKFYNVIALSSRGPGNNCYSWCNWNSELNILWEGNGNNAHDGQNAMTWTGTNGSGNNSGGWDGWGNQISNWMWVTPNGADAVMKGQMTLGDATTGFKFTFLKKDGSQTNPIVLGIEYIKVFGCQAEAINVSGGSTTVCEASDVTLTAQGIGSAGSSYTWYKGTTILPGRNSDTLNVITPIGVGTNETYKAVGEWSNVSVTLTTRLCCSSVGGTSDEVSRQSFNGLPYSCPTQGGGDGSRHGGYADIPDKGTLNFIDPSYIYAGTGCNSLNDGQYAVVQSSYAGNYWQNRPEVKDHTVVPAGSGALFINAAGGAGKAFYKFSLPALCDSTRYEFSAWYASLATGTEIKPNIEFAVMNGAIKVESVTSGFIPENSKWYQANVTFFTPASNSPTYTLQIVNLEGSTGSGNDVMIDDIVVKKCTPFINLYQDGTKDSVLDVCNNSPVDLKVNTYYDLPSAITGSPTGTVYYQWMKATSPSGPWTLLGTPETTGSYSATPTATTTYYRAKVSGNSARAATGQPPLATECGNDGMTTSFKLTKGGNLTIPAITGATTYCVGNTMKLTGDPGTGDQWEWRKGTSFATATVIPGYAYSNDVTKKEYSKTFATADATNYYFMVKQASGCEGYSTVTVTASPIPTATISGTTTVCQNATSPNITFTGAGGTAPYTFTYNIDGGTDKTVTTTSGNSVTVTASTSAVGAATYTLTAVTGTGASCSNTITGQTAKVTVNLLPTATITGTTTVSVNATPAPNIIFTGADGTAPYTFTYTINNGTNLTVTTSSGNSATVTASTSAAGTFVYKLISVKDAGAATCSNTSGGTATITVSDLPGAVISGTTSVCLNATNPIITFSGSNGTAPYIFTYNINGGADINVTSGPGLNVTTITHPTNAIGTFVYTLTKVKESSSTQLTNTITGQSITITVSDFPNITGTASVCKGSTTQLSGSGTPASANAWVSSTPSVATVDNTGKVTGVSAGSCVIAYTNSSFCSNTVTVTVNDLPAITGTSPLCQGSSTQLAGSGTPASSNPWVSATTSVATVDNTGNVTALSAGTSVITYTNSNGCSINTTMTVVSLPSAPTGTDGARCGTGTVTLNAVVSGAATDVLKWYSDAALTSLEGTGTSFTTPNISTTTPYYVTETNTSGCASATAKTVIATVNPGPSAPTGTGATRCGAGTVTLIASVNGNATDVVNWYSDATLTTKVATGTSFTTPSINTTTDYYITEATISGCASTPVTVTATINPVPGTPTGTGAARCGDGTATLNVTPSGATGDVITWYSDATLTTQVATGTSFTTPSLSTTTIYYVTETNSFSCVSAVAQVTATINQVPAAPTGTDASRCGEGTVILSAAVSGNATDIIKWYSDVAFTTQVSTGTSFTTPSISTTTIYYITETSTAGCASTTATTVTAIINQKPPAPTVSDVAYCQGATATPLMASGTNLLWYIGTTTSTEAPTPPTDKAGTFVYYVTSSNGTCESDKAKITVTVNAVTAYAGGPTVYVPEGGSAIINGKATGNNITIKWSPGTYLNDTDTIQPTVKPLSNKTYTLLVTSREGCKASDKVDVVILKNIIIPNIFSPNGDGYNDVWVIRNLELYPGAEISVFNRYGQPVFESVGYDSHYGWDGTSNGKPLPVGTYYYIIKSGHGKPILTGTIAIVK